MPVICPTADWRRYRPYLWPAVLLWSWQVETLWLGLVIAVGLELPRLIPLRMEISQGDFDRMWNFTAVLFLAVLFYLGLSRQGLDAVGMITGESDDYRGEISPDGLHRASGTALTILRCLPGVLAPFIASVVWSRSYVLPWSTFSLYEQARAKRQPLVPPAEWTRRSMHPGYLFIAVCLFSAGMSSLHQQLFLPLMVLVLLVALHPVRTRGHGPLAWGFLVLFLGLASLGARYGREMSQVAWAQLEERLLREGEGLAVDLPSFPFGNFNQTSRSVAIGAIGTMKQSGTVILRIKTSDAQPPGLLREASLNRFRGGGWDIHPHLSETDEVVNGLTEGQTLTITRSSIDGQAPLAVPGDTAQVIVPSPAQVQPVGLGALQVRNALPVATYLAQRGKLKNCLDEPPEPDDLRLDPLTLEELDVLDGIVRELGLGPKLSAGEAGQRLEHWFATNFTYSLYQSERPIGVSPLVNFLTRTRSGHCEYFATATVLILRAAGIQSRYAVGFSVSEWVEDHWIARGRDAHAWTMIWDGKRWQDLDTTPGTWRGTETATKPWHEEWTDAYADLMYRFSLWRQEGGSWQLVVFLTGTAILAWIAWRQLRGSAWRRAQKQALDSVQMVRLGMDSEAIALWSRLGRHHEPRQPTETVRAWLSRIGLLYAGGDDLDELVALHDRLRFDPEGLSPHDRHRLVVLVREFQERIPATGLRPAVPLGSPGPIEI